MKKKQHYSLVFIVVYLALIFAGSKVHGLTSTKLQAFTLNDGSEKSISYKSIYDLEAVNNALTVGFKLDFIQKPTKVSLEDLLPQKPVNEKWQARASIYKDLFDIVEYSRENVAFIDAYKTDEMVDFIKAYETMGYIFYPSEPHIAEALKYYGTYDIYKIDAELKYEKINICRIFEHKDDKYRTLVISGEEGFHIAFDQGQNGSVDDLYYMDARGQDPLGLNKLKGLEVTIYQGLVAMIQDQKNQSELTFNTDQFILLRQVKEIR